MQPHLAVPSSVGSRHQRTAHRIDIGIGRIEDNVACQPLMVFPSLGVELFGLLACRRGEYVCANTTVKHGIRGLSTKCPLNGLSVRFTISRFKTVCWVGVHVATAVELRSFDVAHHHLDLSISGHPLLFKLPDGRLYIGLQQHGDGQRSLAPRGVRQLIETFAGIVAGLGMGGQLQRCCLTISSQSETDVLVSLGAIDGKDGPVAGLQAIFSITAVEGTVVTFVTILADNVMSVWIIM